MSISPTVSIICLTYNEEAFVRDCFNGFLMQESNFSFEVLVYDDASTDNTPRIIQEYCSLYPDIFKATLYHENNFSKGLGYLGLREGFREAKGRYIAYCEGDDYWTDKYKLQRQVDFLDHHPEFYICAHETIIRNSDLTDKDILFTHTKVNIFIDRTIRNHYTFNDTLTGNIFHISSMMVRNREQFTWPEWSNKVIAFDMVLFMILAEHGDIWLMREPMSVYRLNKGSITSSQNSFENQAAFNAISIDILSKMDIFWNKEYHKSINRVISRYHISSMIYHLKTSHRNVPIALHFLKEAFLSSPHNCIKYAIIESLHIIKNHLP